MSANRPPVISQHRGRAGAAVLRVFARPSHLPYVSVRRRQERFRKRSGDEIGTEVDPQPLLRRPIEKVVQHERFGASTAPSTRPACCSANAQSPRRIAIRSSYAAGGARACRSSRQSRIERSNVRLVRRRQFSLHLAGCQARELRQELQPAPSARRRPVPADGPQKTETASTRRTPAPETVAACRHQKKQRRHGAIAAGVVLARRRSVSVFAS